MAVERGQAVQVVRAVVEWVRGDLGHADVSYLIAQRVDACRCSEAGVQASMGVELEDAGGIETRRRRRQERVRADMTQRVVGRFAWSVPSATLSLVTPLKQGLSRRFSFLRRIASKSSRSGHLKFANPCLSIFYTTPQTRLSPHTLPPRLPTHTPPSEINMSVVGVDLGTLNSVIAVARNRGVDVVSSPGRIAYIKILTPVDCK